VSGTGSFKDWRGGGWMVAKFGKDPPKSTPEDGETFTGTVAR